jgi:hypothetical protein
MRSEITLITPMQAQKWMDDRKENRNLSEKHIAYLANEIRSGRWRLTHQGVAFAEDGRLIDGQHRLAAIIAAGIAVNMMVTYGVPDKEFPIIDRGLPRTMGVITGISPKFTEVYTFMLMMASGTKIKTSPDDVVLLHKYLGDLLESLKKTVLSSIPFYSSVPIRTAAIVAIHYGEDRSYVFRLYRNLVLQNYKELPPIAMALVKIHQKEPGSNGYTFRLDTYAKARHLFNRTNANLERLKIQPVMRNGYCKNVIDLVVDILGKNPSKSQEQLKKELEKKDKQIRDIQTRLLKKTSLDIQAEQSLLSMEAKN